MAFSSIQNYCHSDIWIPLDLDQTQKCGKSLKTTQRIATADDLFAAITMHRLNLLFKLVECFQENILIKSIRPPPITIALKNIKGKEK